jgi:hypothetical protein
VFGITPFIATIAVPQRKNGAISNKDAKGERIGVIFSCIVTGWALSAKRQKGVKDNIL